MTTVVDPALDDADQPASDQYLISLVRGGNTEAFGALYNRHIESARRLARVLGRDTSEVDDLVAEAFARVLAALRAGKGPDSAFRAYLLTTMKHTRYDRTRLDRRVEYTDDLAKLETPAPPVDPTIERLENSYAARAFSRLPERWRVVLWHTEVEGESPAQVAPLMGLTPNGVAALAYRARERLRQMYLQEHIAITGSPRCHWTGSHLAGYVRAALARRDRTRVEDHLSECAECRRLHRELAEENSGLRVVLAPLLLGAAAPGYLAELGRGAGGLLGLGTAVSWLTGTWSAFVAWWRHLWQQGIDALAGLGTATVAGWAWLLGWPRRLIRRYGPGNVAAATGLVAATLVGVLAFVLIAALPQRTPSTSALPVPTPADAVPTRTEPPSAIQSPEPPLVIPTGAVPRPTMSTLAELPVATPARARPATKPAASPKAKPAAASEVPQLRPDPAGADLIAGQDGVLAIGMRMPESTAAKPSRSPTASSSPKKDQMQLTVRLPSGLTPRAGDAGDGWICRPASGGATCDREPLRRGQQSVARIPVTVAEGVSGFQPIEAEMAVGGKRSSVSFRAPVAPAGLRVGQWITGRLGLSLAGNTLISCRPRPACLSKDNNMLELEPLRPGAGEPSPPPGLDQPGGPTSPSGQISRLAGAKAASGARLDLPDGAKVRWAGLIFGASGKSSPTGVSTPETSARAGGKVTKSPAPASSDNGGSDKGGSDKGGSDKGGSEPVAALHGPDGGWHQLKLSRTSGSAGATVSQWFADVTDLVRSPGDWWLVTSAASLPRGTAQVAGWSLVVAYEDPSAAPGELAVYLGPTVLAKQGKVTARLGAAGQVQAGIVIWDGDHILAGDAMRLGDLTVGDPANLATGQSPSADALQCAGVPGCVWRSTGLDVQTYRAKVPGRGNVTLEAGDDPMELGMLAVLTPIGQEEGAAAGGR